MPRKPLRCHKSLRHQPLSFSPFARSMAMIACAKKAKNKSQQIKLRNKDVQSSSSNGKVELSDSSVDEEFQGVVQADFVFFDPKPGDFHGIKVLLQTYLDHKQWDLSGFVDLVLGQPTVGTVVKIENDEDDGVYSVVTVLNLERYKNNKCLTEFKDYLLEVCQGKDVVASLKSLFGEHALGVGIIVSQRVVNLPSQLLPPLYDALFDEIAWATEDEPTDELRNSFRFKTYIVISKIYKHKNADQNTGKARNGDEVVIHIKPEDEILLELSSWSFCFPLHAQQVTTSELKNYRLMGLAMVVDANKVSMFRKQLHLLIDESQYHESFQQSCQIQDSVVSPRQINYKIFPE
ncbi:protein BCCIP homolog [Primulina huaijiensis]|uniref:protein BCCIP homolog n=1 Tax=Primulina huaijiensis TaxID=1492673 RepID=UPI003CC755E0